MKEHSSTNEVRGPYAGTLIDYEGQSPGPDPTYIVDVRMPDGVKRFQHVRPAYWRWDDLGVDEDAAKTISTATARSTTIVCYVHRDKLIAIFATAPAVGAC